MIDPAVLKRDKQYNRAAIGGYVLAIILTVAVGAVALPDIGWLERRGTATYWLIMTPAAVWLIALASFSRWAIALLPFVLVGAPVSLAGLALTHLPGDRGTLLLYFIVVGLAAVIGLASLGWLKKSAAGRP